MAEIREFIITPDDIGLRLDKYLADKMPEFSRSEIQRFEITQRGAGVKMGLRLRDGDMFSVTIPDMVVADTATENVSCDFDLDIIFEDDDILVINKPRGVVMYPSAGNQTGTLVQNILAHTNLSALGGATRPGVVHRLDKDTSGVMVFAKSDAAYRELVKTFSEHKITRRYLCFAWGVPSWESADITGNIARSARNRQKMTMVKIGGKPAHTEVSVVRAWSRAGVSELRCNLLTGRTHQIRVHLSSHGLPVLCDPVYGRGSTRFGTVRDSDLLDFIKTHNGQMLHAQYLAFRHPVTDAELSFKTRLPDDMAELKYLLDEMQTA